MGIEALLMLAVYILILALVVWAINVLFTRMGLDPDVRKIFMVAVAILFLILILRQLGMF